MSFAVHPEDEEFLTKFARDHPGARNEQFWPLGVPVEPFVSNGQAGEQHNAARANKQTKLEQTKRVYLLGAIRTA